MNMFHFPRLRSLSQALLAGAALCLAPMVWAQSGPVKVLVGFPPGGGTDAIARILADKLKDQLGVPVVVENKAGAGGQIAAQALKAAAPDGNTVFLSHDHTISILPLVVKTPASNHRATLWPSLDLRPLSMRWQSLVVLRPSRLTTTAPGCAAPVAAKARWVCPHPPRCPSFWSK